MKRMRTAVMSGIGKIEYKERSIPVPLENQVLVKINHVGICGSDIHYFENGRIGDYVVKPPFVLGHEAAGTIVQVGENVSHLVIGDRVALEPGISCGQCEYCLTGNYNLCPDVIFFATPPVDGVFQDYVAHEARLCFKLPDNVSTFQGALIEPLSVGFHAAIQGNARLGQTAVVLGCGCIGLVSMLALKAVGVEKVYMVDILPNRLAKALELGATAAIDAGASDAVAKISEFTNKDGCDLAIDTSGTEAAIGQAVSMVKKGGTVVFVGYSNSDKVKFPLNLSLDKEITFKTVFRYRHIYPLAIDAVASGKINLGNIVTHVFPFSDIQEAMEQSINNKEKIVKAVVSINDENK